MRLSNMMNKEYFKELESQHLSISKRNDLKEIISLMDEEYLEIGASGNIYHYQDYCDVHKLDDETRIFEIKEYDIKIVNSEIVISTYLLYEPFKQVSTYRSTTWVLRDDGWKMIFHQGTIKSA